MNDVRLLLRPCRTDSEWGAC